MSRKTRHLRMVAPGSINNGPAGPAKQEDIEAAWISAVTTRDGVLEATGSRSAFSVSMGGRGMNDDTLKSWCTWFDSRYTKSAGRELVAHELNFSNNQLTGVGIECLFNMFKRKNIHVSILKFYQNRIASAQEVAEFLSWNGGSVREVHLSHNQLNTAAAHDIIVGAVMAKNSKGEQCYPRSVGAGGAHSSVPLWLRLEKNIIDVGEMNTQVGASLAKAGYSMSKAICHVDGATDCNSGVCRRWKGASPAAVHLAHINQQERRSSAPSIKVLPTPQRSSPKESASGAKAPPKYVPTSRGWTTETKESDVDDAPTPTQMSREEEFPSLLAAGPAKASKSTRKEEEEADAGDAPTPTQKSSETWFPSLPSKGQYFGIPDSASKASKSSLKEDTSCSSSIKTKAVHPQYWTCPRCGDDNKYSRPECNTCRHARCEDQGPEVGDAPTPKQVNTEETCPSLPAQSSSKTSKSLHKEEPHADTDSISASSTTADVDNRPSSSSPTVPASVPKKNKWKKRKEGRERKAQPGDRRNAVDTVQESDLTRSKSEESCHNSRRGKQPAQGDSSSRSVLSSEQPLPPSDTPDAPKPCEERAGRDSEAATSSASRPARNMVVVNAYRAEAAGYLSVERGDQVQALSDMVEGDPGCAWPHYVFCKARNLERGQGWLPLQILWELYSDDSGREWLHDPKSGAGRWWDELFK